MNVKILFYFLFSCIVGVSVTGQTLIKPGDPCSQDIDCDPSRFIICNTTSSTCDCEDKMLYDTERQECQQLVGYSCDRNPACIADAQCKLPEQVCECNPGFLPWLDGVICMLGHNSQCDLNRDRCHPELHFKCNETTSTCLCNEEGHTYEWSPAHQRCAGIVGRGRCFYDADICIAGAECGEFDICECDSTHSRTADGTRCMLKYNAQCQDPASNPTLPEWEKCNTKEFLVCSQNQVCDCDPGQEMEYDGRVYEECRVKLGGTCNMTRHCNYDAVCDGGKCVCKADAYYTCSAVRYPLSLLTLLTLLVASVRGKNY